MTTQILAADIAQQITIVKAVSETVILVSSPISQDAARHDLDKSLDLGRAMPTWRP